MSTNFYGPWAIAVARSLSARTPLLEVVGSGGHDGVYPCERGSEFEVYGDNWALALLLGQEVHLAISHSFDRDSGIIALLESRQDAPPHYFQIVATSLDPLLRSPMSTPLYDFTLPERHG